MKMYTAKRTLKFLAGLMLFVLVFLACSYMVAYRSSELPYNVTTKVQGFYQEDKNSLDVVFLGPSGIFFGINPSYLWREFGIPSYVFAANEQPLWVSYAYLKEVFNRQSPKVVALEIGGTRYDFDYSRDEVTRINLDSLPFSWNKLEAIFNSVPSDMRMSYLFDISKYHSRWSQLTFRKPLQFWADKDPLKGYTPDFMSYPEHTGTVGDIPGLDDVGELTEKTSDYLQKIMDLCKEHGAELLLLKTPYFTNAPDQLIYNRVEQIAKENNIHYLDLNSTENIQKMEYDVKADASDFLNHANWQGAQKITRFVGAYLREQFSGSIPDRRQDDKYKNWNEETSYYYHLLRNLELPKEQLFYSYLELVKNKNYLVVFSGLQDFSFLLGPKQLAALQELGLSVNLEGQGTSSFAAVVNAGECIYEAVDSQAIDYRQAVSGEIFIELQSAGTEAVSTAAVAQQPAASSIRINGVEYSMNSNGLNMVVYDILSKKVIDTVNFGAQHTNRAFRKGDILIGARTNNPQKESTDPEIKTLQTCNDIYEYMEQVSKIHYTMMIVANDDSSYGVTEELYQTMMYTLGLETDLRGKPRYSYIAVWQDGQVLYEKLSEIPLYYAYQCNQDNTFEMYSAGYTYGAQGSISLQGQNLGNGGRGLQIVVFDQEKNTIIDSVTFDTCFDLQASR